MNKQRYDKLYDVFERLEAITDAGINALDQVSEAEGEAEDCVKDLIKLVEGLQGKKDG